LSIQKENGTLTVLIVWADAAKANGADAMTPMARAAAMRVERTIERTEFFMALLLLRIERGRRGPINRFQEGSEPTLPLRSKELAVKPS